MAEIERGLYEQLVTEALASTLTDLGRGLEARRGPLRNAEAADRIALHLGRLVHRALAALSDKERVHAGVRLARDVIARLGELDARAVGREDAPVEPGEVLQAVARRLPSGATETIEAPLIPLLDTTLLTNAPGEPRVGHQLATEIHSADRIDVVMAFIRRSGIRALLGALKDHCAEGRALRVLTTTYTGSTEGQALEQLEEIGASVRVSYEPTRLGARASTRRRGCSTALHRGSGFSTATIGSSNLTHGAQISGLEWNVRVSGARNPDVIGKVDAVFESYWNGGDFVPFVREEFAERTRSERASRCRASRATTATCWSPPPARARR